MRIYGGFPFHRVCWSGGVEYTAEQTESSYLAVHKGHHHHTTMTLVVIHKTFDKINKKKLKNSLNLKFIFGFVLI